MFLGFSSCRTKAKPDFKKSDAVGKTSGDVGSKFHKRVVVPTPVDSGFSCALVAPAPPEFEHSMHNGNTGTGLGSKSPERVICRASGNDNACIPLRPRALRRHQKKAQPAVHQLLNHQTPTPKCGVWKFPIKPPQLPHGKNRTRQSATSIHDQSPPTRNGAALIGCQQSATLVMVHLHPLTCIFPNPAQHACLRFRAASNLCS